MTAVLPIPSRASPQNHMERISMAPHSPPELPTTSTSLRNGHLNLGMFPPVTQNGSFEFDRVIKRGYVHKRVQKNRAWKTTWRQVHLVLRPNLLSVYKDEDEAELRASITLSDITAVAAMKASKSKREHVFGIYTPSRNYYFQGQSTADSLDWVERLRSEAHVDAMEEQLFLASRSAQQDSHETHSLSEHDDEDRSSSPEPAVERIRITRRRGDTMASASGRPRQVSTSHDFSGNEMTSYSDFSDTAAETKASGKQAVIDHPSNTSSTPQPPIARNVSPMSGIDLHDDLERVVWQGYLYYLKTKGGVRQWKKLWVVLRSKRLSFYKNDQEYSAVLIIPMPQIINVAEIDPVSRGKKFCLQIIAEEKTYRFCAPDEDSLEKWLGAFKATLSRQNEATKKAPIL